MADEKKTWAEQVAARAMGLEPEPEDVAAAHRWKRRPRTVTERRILERLGFTDDETPPAA
ncbi:hypothetical protein F7R91_05620 [Streptomyces luteolifulvus]|uniref:Uncharacterized protein n=1 Tax=Streptomyces luteolifulvus TaxID=2615112 RepID=A0A6H9V6S2_9ACTN|nr:hypothetical protein [Streptomyces luteolifulvus]KAB1149237.1 hypothetical protein F7R91_05620 [Streptomyces luteolifulvus]